MSPRLEGPDTSAPMLPPRPQVMSLEAQPPVYNPFADPNDPSNGDDGSDGTNDPTNPLPPALAKRYPRPTNYLYISGGDHAIRGAYAIDPAMRIPPAVLPPLEDGEEEGSRKNLKMTTRNGSISADILLIGPKSENDGFIRPGRGDVKKRGRAQLEMTSEGGSITVSMRKMDTAPSFKLKLTSGKGSIHTNIPRTFHGLLHLASGCGSVSIADELRRNSTPLSQVGDTQLWFVGDFSVFTDDEWHGDEVEVNAAHASIRVRYVTDRDGVGRCWLADKLFSGCCS
ncbi:hypothetical protein CONPUDRAFT_168299 [Coniophora puteana RWD-64-598 SS2]|uniref:DUF7330 domain-containing protein n=1 Tax=Coniophora puteana (strain RWD-64-598) TaxID=741705 RepID=A0A5M3MEC4_CONPW|nr:uncharacterized protein CONPUDRAFT_168299 [Coniophora puteana RWD-64-598 SS2]EIW77356.1 hypothetical protein CONPUDRAFT_168299 [Coniophora puteana RWD-64-598 SS2]